VSSHIVNVTAVKDMCSVSVRHRKVLSFLVVDRHWKYGVQHSTKSVCNGLNALKTFLTQKIYVWVHSSVWLADCLVVSLEQSEKRTWRNWN
jgi:hypothetical protein